MSPLLLYSNTNQYNINGLLCTYTKMFAYRHAAATFYQLQRGFGGRRQHAGIQGILAVLFSPHFILQITEGFQWFYRWENILILNQGSRGLLLSGEGGVLLFPWGGPNANFYRNPYTYLLFSKGGPDPLSPSGSAHGQCNHNGTIFITARLLTIIVRHWFCQD